jgi:hypothetical protein
MEEFGIGQPQRLGWCIKMHPRRHAGREWLGRSGRGPGLQRQNLKYAKGKAGSSSNEKVTGFLSVSIWDSHIRAIIDLCYSSIQSTNQIRPLNKLCRTPPIRGVGNNSRIQYELSILLRNIHCKDLMAWWNWWNLDTDSERRKQQCWAAVLMLS